MAGWLPSPFSLFTFRSPAPSSASSDPLPPPPITLSTPERGRRLPAPPLRGSAPSRTESTSGFKRERQDSGSGVHAEEVEHDEGSSPARKKRRGMVGTALSTAFDAAIFATAIGYSAYRMWKSPPTAEELEAYRQRKLEAPLQTLPIEAPPPYSEAPSTASQPHIVLPPPTPASFSPSLSRPSAFAPGGTSSPSQIPRRVRHIHEPRPRPSPRPSFGRPSTSPSSSFAIPPANPTPASLPEGYDPFAALLARTGPLPEFQPYNSPRTARTSTFGQGEQPEEDEAEDDEVGPEEDEEMRAVSERLKSLIETGAQALVSRPQEWGAPPPRPSSAGAVGPSPSTARARKLVSELGEKSSVLSRGRSLGGGIGSPVSSSSSSGAGRARQSLSTFASPTTSSRSRASPLSPPAASSSSSRFPAPPSPSASSRHRRRSSGEPSTSSFPVPSSPRASTASSGSMRRAATTGQEHGRRSSVGGRAGGETGAAERLEGAVRKRGSLAGLQGGGGRGAGKGWWEQS
ncbi:hypothetical protein JCM8547_004974 [Rhodosporidiobolus lusitaniae]